MDPTEDGGRFRKTLKPMDIPTAASPCISSSVNDNELNDRSDNAADATLERSNCRSSERRHYLAQLFSVERACVLL